MIVPSFEAKGGITTVVNGYPGSELEKHFQMRYIETYCDGSKWKKLGKAIGAYLEFLKVLLTDKPDLLHIHAAFGASFYRKAPFVYLAYFLNVPVILHIHGAEWSPFFSEASGAEKKWKKKIINKCSRIIVLSDEWGKKLEEATASDKIAVVENFSAITDFEKSNTNQSKWKVLFLGFLCKRKGCFNIPDVVTKVCNEMENVTFILAGSGEDEDYQCLIELIQKYDCENHVDFPGWIRGKEKEELLKIADIFFLPSYAEGMPMSILEAMGYGLPVVSTTVGGIPQLVEHGVNGYLYEPGDVDGFTEGILRLLRDPELRDRMGKAGYDRVKESFSFEAHTEKIIQLYDKVIFGESI